MQHEHLQGAAHTTAFSPNGQLMPLITQYVRLAKARLLVDASAAPLD